MVQVKQKVALICIDGWGVPSEHSPAEGIEGGLMPGLAHEGHADGQVLEAEPLEDVNQAIHVHLLPSLQFQSEIFFFVFLPIVPHLNFLARCWSTDPC